eukprot:1143192-Pelagomonas_calceolata.AAC.6
MAKRRNNSLYNYTKAIKGFGEEHNLHVSRAQPLTPHTDKTWPPLHMSMHFFAQRKLTHHKSFLTMMPDATSHDMVRLAMRVSRPGVRREAPIMECLMEPKHIGKRVLPTGRRPSSRGWLAWDSSSCLCACTGVVCARARNCVHYPCGGKQEAREVHCVFRAWLQNVQEHCAVGWRIGGPKMCT